MKPTKTKNHCPKCKQGKLVKVPFENLYHCNRCMKRFKLPHDKALSVNRQWYREKGRLMNKAVLRDGVFWYR